MAQVHAQPLHNGTSASSSPAPTSLSWTGDKMLNIYIHDYFVKHGFDKTARELCAEAELDSATTLPPINAPQGLLFEWWVVFWEIFQAKSNKSGSQDALLYVEHQARIRAQQQQQQQVNAPHSAMGRVLPPGMQQRGPMPPGMPNGINGQPQLPGASPYPSGGVVMTNGMAGPSAPMQSNPQAMGQLSGNASANMQRPLQTRPPNYGSPVLTQAGQPPGPGQGPPPQIAGTGPPHLARATVPQTMMASNSSHMQSGMMQNPGQVGQYPPGIVRPASRAATPAQQNMMQGSPRMTHQQAQQVQEQFNRDYLAMIGYMDSLPRGAWLALAAQAGITEKETQNLNALSDDQRRRLVAVYKSHVSSASQQQQNAAGGPSRLGTGPSPNGGQIDPSGSMGGQMPPPRTRGAKRGSTSPPDESEAFSKDSSPPDRKRVRRSPQPGEGAMQMTPGQPGVNVQQPQMNGVIRPGPQINGMHPTHAMQGMPGMPGGSGMQMGNMTAGMGGMGGPMMGQPNPQMMQNQMRGQGGQMDPNFIQYRMNMANMHQTKVAPGYQGHPGQPGPAGLAAHEQIMARPGGQLAGAGPAAMGTPALGNRPGPKGPANNMMPPASPSMAATPKPQHGMMQVPQGPAGGMAKEGDGQEAQHLTNGTEETHSSPARPPSASNHPANLGAPTPTPGSGSVFGADASSTTTLGNSPAPPPLGSQQRAAATMSGLPTSASAPPVMQANSASQSLSSSMFAGDLISSNIGSSWFDDPEMAFESEFDQWISDDPTTRDIIGGL